MSTLGGLVAVVGICLYPVAVFYHWHQGVQRGLAVLTCLAVLICLAALGTNVVIRRITEAHDSLEAHIIAARKEARDLVANAQNELTRTFTDQYDELSRQVAATVREVGEDAETAGYARGIRSKEVVHSPFQNGQSVQSVSQMPRPR